jgi:hypothetical protein
MVTGRQQQTAAGVYKAKSICGTLSALLVFVRFLKLHKHLVQPHHTLGVDSDKLKEIKLVLKNVHRSYSKNAIEERQQRLWDAQQDMCDPKVFGRFLASPDVTDVWDLMDDVDSGFAVASLANFVKIRDTLMLAVGMRNARRTGDIVNMTVVAFEASVTSVTNSDCHVVRVKQHKTATTQICKVNFYARLHDTALKYVKHFRRAYLKPALRMFPHVVAGKAAVPMRAITASTTSESNVCGACTPLR